MEEGGGATSSLVIFSLNKLPSFIPPAFPNPEVEMVLGCNKQKCICTPVVCGNIKDYCIVIGLEGLYEIGSI